MRLGKTHLEVSRVGFGGLPIQRLQTSEAESVVRHAFDLGINFFDTARAYPTSEKRIGNALRSQRGRVVIATKTLARDGTAATADLRESLRALRTEYIDLWQLHNVSTIKDYDGVTAPGGALEAARRAVQRGDVRHVGLSSHSLEIADRAIRSGEFETVQVPFNTLSPEASVDTLPCAASHNVGLIAMKPFAGGVIEEARLAIKYLLQFPTVLPIPGIERKQEIEEIVSLARDAPLISPDEWEEIRRLRARVGVRFCRRCGYCLPCPQGIPIPVVLHLEDMQRRVSASRFAKRGAEVAELASTCTQCGQCENKCPYNLPIRMMLHSCLAFYERICGHKVKERQEM